MVNSIEKAPITVSQIRAASDVLQSLQEVEVVKTDPSLIGVKETDAFRLRRGLCLPSAVATCINAVKNERVVGETHEDAPLTLGDFFSVVLPYHNREGLIDVYGKRIPYPWRVVTDTGNMYHHAAVAFTEGLGVHSLALLGFQEVGVFTDFLHAGGRIAVSLDNTFVINETFKRNPNYVRMNDDGTYDIRTDNADGTGYQRFEKGRHVVSLLGMDDSIGKIHIHDSFRLPQMEESTELQLPTAVINKYLEYQVRGVTRAIAFAENEELLKLVNNYANDVFVPIEVIASVKKLYEAI